jgi:tetratricopeptide (TPR) repeat protein
MTRPTAAVHRTIIVVDVEGFGDHRRTNADQIVVRAGLYAALRQAFEHTGISWEECEHEDRGDGVLILAPAEVLKSPFAELLPGALATALRAHNQANPTERRIRLRVALHAGEINYDDHGVTAIAINLAFRLVEAIPLKDALAGSAAVVAIITSAWFFDEVVRQSTLCDVAAYQRISVKVKETTTTAWICLLVEAVAAHQVEPALLGRDHEMARLHLAAMNARRGQFTLAWITGESGIGKSALGAALGKRLADEGWSVAWGNCLEPDGRSAGRPWTEILSELVSQFPPDHEQAVELAPLFENHTSSPARGDEPAARFRLRAAVSSYLRAGSRTTPMLVVLDDLHHADREALVLLAYLVGDLPTQPILVVGTYRPDGADEHLDDMLATLAKHEPLNIDLAGLDRSAIATLISRLCGRVITDDTIAVVLRRTEGNPFFVREIARLLDTDGEQAAIADVPPGVRHTVRRRVARLPEATQTALCHAAVIGQDFSLDVLAAITGLAVDALIEFLDDARRAGLLIEPPVGFRTLRFAHALVSDTLYHDLSRLRRAGIHARIGAAMERLRPDDAAALAYHFNAAQTPEAADKAARYLQLAARQAERRHAHRKAAVLWQKALRSYARSATGTIRERLELTIDTIRALATAGDHGAVRALRDEAVAEAIGLGDPKLTARVIVAYDAQGLWQHNDDGEVVGKIVDAIDRTLHELPVRYEQLRCRLLASLASELERSEDSRSDPASLEAVRIARRLGDPSLLAIALNARFRQSYWTSTLTEREQIATELLVLGQNHGLVTVEAVGRQALLRCACGRGQFTVAAEHAAESERLAATYDLPTAAATASWYYGLHHTINGRYSEAARAYQRATELTRRIGMAGVGQGLSVIAALSLAIWTGKLAELVPAMNALYARYPTAGAEAYALALAAAGRHDEARAVATRRAPIPRDIMYKLVMTLRGLVGLALNDQDRVAEAYHALRPLEDEMAGGDTGGFVVLFPVAQILGDLAVRLGELQAANAHYLKSRQIAERANVAAWISASREALSRTIARSRPHRVW